MYLNRNLTNLLSCSSLWFYTEVSFICWPIFKSLLYHFHVHKNRVTIWKLSEKAPNGWCNLREKFSRHLSELAVIDEFVWIFVHSMFLPSCAPAHQDFVFRKNLTWKNLDWIKSNWLCWAFLLSLTSTTIHGLLNLGMTSMLWMGNSLCCFDWCKTSTAFQGNYFCHLTEILLLVALRCKYLSNAQHANFVVSCSAITCNLYD